MLNFRKISFFLVLLPTAFSLPIKALLNNEDKSILKEILDGAQAKISQGISDGVQASIKQIQPYVNEKTINKTSHNTVLKAIGAGIAVASLNQLVFRGISTLFDTRKAKQTISDSDADADKKAESQRLDSRNKAWMKIYTGSAFVAIGALLIHNSYRINNWLHADESTNS